MRPALGTCHGTQSGAARVVHGRQPPNPNSYVALLSSRGGTRTRDPGIMRAVRAPLPCRAGELTAS